MRLPGEAESEILGDKISPDSRPLFGYSTVQVIRNAHNNCAPEKLRERRRQPEAACGTADFEQLYK